MHDSISSLSNGKALQREIRVEQSAYYSVQAPARNGDAPPPLVILCHGYGQSSNTILRIFSPLLERGFLLAAPQGPNAFYWQQTGKVGFAWLTRFQKENALADIMTYLSAFVDDLHQTQHFDKENIFVVGFSQGGGLASRFGTHGILEPRGIVSCGADLPPDVAERLDDIPKVPYRIVHGRNDKSVTIEKGEQAETTLREHGFDVTTSYYDGGHELPEEEVHAIAEWIEAKVGERV